MRIIYTFIFICIWSMITGLIFGKFLDQILILITKLSLFFNLEKKTILHFLVAIYTLLFFFISFALEKLYIRICKKINTKLEEKRQTQ